MVLGMPKSRSDKTRPAHSAPLKTVATLAISGVLASTALTGGAHIAAAQPAAAIHSLGWGPCPVGSFTSDATQCITFDVPKVYNNPSAGTIELTMSRVPATKGPAETKGVIVGNPGGPGGDALAMFDGDAGIQFPEAVKEHFDLIAVEPRGLAFGTPLNCDIGEVPGAILANINAGALRSACEAQNPGYAATITTANTARDLEEARKVLGQDKLNLYGVSYGTDLMASYATMFPEHVDKTILDSSVNPGSRWLNLGPDRRQARKEGMDALFAWIAERNDTYGLGDTPLKVYQSWSNRISSEVGAPAAMLPPDAEVGDIPPGLENYQDALLPAVNQILPYAWRGQSALAALVGLNSTTSPTFSLTFAGLYDERVWATIADAIKTGEYGKKAMEEQQKQITNPGSVNPAEDPTQMLMSMVLVERSIICNDNTNAPDRSRAVSYYADSLTGGDVNQRNADFLGSGVICDGWNDGKPAGTGPSLAVDYDGSKLAMPPLLLHHTHDSAVTGTAGRAMQQRMGGDLIEIDGYSHGVLLTSTDKVAEQVTKYLFS